jgi:hypothetical protein
LKNGKNLRFFASLYPEIYIKNRPKQKVKTQNQNAKNSKRFAYSKPKPNRSIVPVKLNEIYKKK